MERGICDSVAEQIMVNWVFFQVSIAVLLDSFLTANKSIKDEEIMRKLKEHQLQKQLKNPLDPLLLELAKEYLNDVDLSARLHRLFQVP